MQAIGLEIPRGGVIADGQIHRCNASGSGEHGKGDGAYCLHLEETFLTVGSRITETA
jgi:hypothetical protein